ncbi:UNVERIFIED_CONTAM: hypothetical protein RMT77_019541 [Armadillidium vulgare]
MFIRFVIFLLLSYVVAITNAKEECNDCTLVKCAPESSICPNSYYYHPCFCCPSCLPITQKYCKLNCTGVSCPSIYECPNGHYRVPGMCCPECL